MKPHNKSESHALLAITRHEQEKWREDKKAKDAVEKLKQHPDYNESTNLLIALRSLWEGVHKPDIEKWKASRPYFWQAFCACTDAIFSYTLTIMVLADMNGRDVGKEGWEALVEAREQFVPTYIGSFADRTDVPEPMKVWGMTSRAGWIREHTSKRNSRMMKALLREKYPSINDGLITEILSAAPLAWEEWIPAEGLDALRTATITIIEKGGTRDKEQPFATNPETGETLYDIQGEGKGRPKKQPRLNPCQILLNPYEILAAKAEAAASSGHLQAFLDSLKEGNEKRYARLMLMDENLIDDDVPDAEIAKRYNRAYQALLTAQDIRNLRQRLKMKWKRFVEEAA